MSAAFRDKYGPYALVAGASVGLGAAFAEQLAERGLNLVLLARRAAVLEPLADRLRSKHRVDVRTAAIDLGSSDLIRDVQEATRDLEIGLVVYNAALSPIGPFLDVPLEEKLKVIDVNCRGPLILADLFGRAMIARGRGGIILMSSLAGTQGTPFTATYAATKAYNLVLAEGLWDELRARGVDVLACRAGATRTPGFEQSNPTPGQAPVMEAGPVVTEALDALGHTPSMIPGRMNRMVAFFLSRALPRKEAVRTMGRAMRRMYGY